MLTWALHWRYRIREGGTCLDDESTRRKCRLARSKRRTDRLFDRDEEWLERDDLGWNHGTTRRRSQQDYCRGKRYARQMDHTLERTNGINMMSNKTRPDASY